MDLLDDKERDENGLDLRVNQAFAAKYEAKKKREELSKLQDKYGTGAEAGESDEESESSTDYSSEDSDAEFVTPQVDAAILKMIGRIRDGGAELYSGNTDFFDEEEKRLARLAATQSKASKKLAKASKPVHLKDYQRNALLATGGRQDEDAPAMSIRTPAQEAEDLRAETKAAFSNAFGGGGDSDDEQEDEADDLLVKRNVQEEEDDVDQYRRFLLESVGQAEVDRALAIQKREARKAGEQGSPSKQDEDDFLKNYILNRGWLDTKSKQLPSYAEITVDDDEKPSKLDAPSGANAVPLLEDSEDEFERAEEFETKYNFRFEEAAGSEIQTHGRDVGTSVRREDDSRKKMRDATKARKAAEKAERMEELKRLKNLKRGEIMDKLAKIREVAGGVDVDALDLEADYDPATHSAKMAAVFDDTYYGDGKIDDSGKPVWDDDIDISDLLPAEDAAGDDAYAPGGEAYDPTEGGPSGKKSRAERKKDKKSKKKSKGKERADHQDDEDEAAVEEVVFDPTELDAITDPEQRKALVEKYMDEYYKLDYEDMIGDLPTRFHYASTSALNPLGTSQDDYALSPAEILMATDAELNAYESLRRLAPYRQTGDKANKKKKKLKELRKILAKRRWGEEIPEAEEAFARPLANYRRSEKRKAPDQDGGDASGEPKGKKKRLGAKQRKKAQAKAEAESQVPAES